jgi:hypothetical protein
MDDFFCFFFSTDCHKLFVDGKHEPVSFGTDADQRAVINRCISCHPILSSDVLSAIPETQIYMNYSHTEEAWEHTRPGVGGGNEHNQKTAMNKHESNCFDFRQIDQMDELKRQLSEMESSVRKLQRQVGWFVNPTVVPIVTYCALCILSALLPPVSKSAIVRPVTSHRQKVKEMAAGDLDFPVSSAYFMRIRRTILKRRQTSAHSCVASDMQSQVKDALRAFELWPKLLKSHIISNYNVLKKHFPKQQLM